MKRIPTLLFTLTLALIAATAIGSLAGCNKKSTSASDAYFCSDPDPRACPTSQFVSDYHEWQDLGKQVTDWTRSPEGRSIQARQDQLNGMAQRLVGQIPAGYQFDNVKMKFVPAQKAATAAPTAPASPAPAAAPAAKKPGTK